MKNIYTGTDDFKDIIENDSYYVDKTKIIEELLSNTSKAMLFPRPRRFGKTLTMSMLYYFFECTIDSKDLFKGLYIESSPYYSEINKYPVIYVSFKSLKKDKYEDVYDAFKLLISRLYVSKRNQVYDRLEESEKKYYDNIENGVASKSEFEESISRLEDFLCKVHKEKVIVLIDEYDMPIQTGYLNGYYEDVVNLIRNIFDGALKTNSSLKFGVLTGVLRVSKESILSGPNNIKTYGLYNSVFGEYFGFTEEEVNKLLNYYGLELTDDVKNMYDGYNFNEVHMYNPWSILNYASDKILDNYWINTSGNEIIKSMLNDTLDENKVQLEKLLLGEYTEFTYDDKLTYKDFDNHNNINTILNLLFASGYLTVKDKKIINNKERIYIGIPNNEVKEYLSKIMLESISKESTNITILSNNILDSIEDYNMELLEKTLNSSLVSVSYYDESESFFHGYMLSIFNYYLCDSNYIVKSNREAGLGRYDVMIERVDKSFGYIFEFKIAHEEDMESVAKTALDQIETKEYYKELELEKVKNIRKVSIVFSNKKCIVR